MQIKFIYRDAMNRAIWVALIISGLLLGYTSTRPIFSVIQQRGSQAKKLESSYMKKLLQTGSIQQGSISNQPPANVSIFLSNETERLQKLSNNIIANDKTQQKNYNNKTEEALKTLQKNQEEIKKSHQKKTNDLFAQSGKTKQIEKNTALLIQTMQTTSLGSDIKNLNQLIDLKSKITEQTTLPENLR